MPETISRAVDLALSPLAHERVTRARSHRPWPMPSTSWVMAQSWLDLLFAHWAVPAQALERVVPPELPLDRWDGRGWIGVTPFQVRNLRLRPTFPIPGLSSFPEINVRTYVTVGGKPGIYFFSLDAGSALAVASARRTYRLPYFTASMSIEPDRGREPGGSIRYLSARIGPEPAPPAARFRGTYRPLEKIDPGPGSLERWLTERYCLYTLDETRQVLRGEIHHPPWALHAAEAVIEENTMAEQIGLELTDPPLLHYSARQDVVFWPLRPA